MRVCMVLLSAIAIAFAALGPVSAQADEGAAQHVTTGAAQLWTLAQASTIINGRRCQTVRQCRFRRGGLFRGCISAFSCRRCRFVRARCRIPGSGAARRCRRLVCNWGAVS